MKLYENGEVRQLNEETQEYELVGRHTVDLDGLLTLTDERGTYASFGNPLPKEVVLFADAEKQAGFILKQLHKLSTRDAKVWVGEVFGYWHGQHLLEKHFNGKHTSNLLEFYRSLDAENSQLLIKALVRL